MSETDIRRAMAQAVREEQLRADRQLKAISRSAKVDLDRLGKSAQAGQEHLAQRPQSKG